MENGANIVHITPFMHVPDLEAAIAWFDLLGFKPLFKMSNYAYLGRDAIAVRVLQSTTDEGTAFPAHRGFAYYVDVRDVDLIVAELEPRLVSAGVEFKGPVDQHYLQREFMIRAPDGNVFVFGQGIPAKPH